jgi:ABC-type histidine transport system ATPase subunit
VVLRVFLQLLPALAAGQKPCLLNGTTGQAAGTASALSIKDDVVLRDLDIHTLQNQLVADGVRIR